MSSVNTGFMESLEEDLMMRKTEWTPMIKGVDYWFKVARVIKEREGW